MEKKVYELKIDEDYKYLIAPLQRREFLQLEENIIADGCREPIVVWNGVRDMHSPSDTFCNTRNGF